MIRIILALVAVCGLVAIASATTTNLNGRIGKQNGFTGNFPLTGGIGAGNVVPQNGFILLVDGTSFILQTDGTSKICRAAGC